VSQRSARSNSPKRVCILVLGMHRSGTSAVVRVLNYLGCDLPKTLLGATRANESGHWESIPICRLDDRILASAGTDWNDWLELNPGWMESPKAEEFRDEALGVLEEEFGSSRLFVLKDPRICRLVPFWLDCLEQAGARTLIVFPVRNPLEVAASLEKRNGLETGLGQLLWLRHVLDAEFASRGTPRFFTGYDRLLSEWARTMEDAQAVLGITWPRMSSQVVTEIEEFLSQKYRHHEEEPDAVLENPRLSGWLRGAYQVLGHWTRAGENPEDFAELDRIRLDLNSAAPAFSRLIAAGHAAAEKVAESDRELTKTKAKLAKVEEAKAAVQDKAKRLEAELKDARRHLRETEKQVEKLKARLKAPGTAIRDAPAAAGTGGSEN
jgi:hypothetical protein